MKLRSIKAPLIAVAALGAVSLAVALTVRSSAQTLAVSELAQNTHVHGLAIDRQDPSYVFVATHHGLFRAGPDGQAERISVVQDFMGFHPNPADPTILYASGHPANGGNLGFIASTDGGKTWVQISPGANGPADFHQMAVSAADPNVIYGGGHDGLQVSRDAGRSWTAVGPLPAGLIDLAASAQNPDRLYGATERGLLASVDAGKTWQPMVDGPTSLVEATPDGTLYAFVVGRGLLRASAGQPEFTTISSDWGNQVLLHLAVDPANPDRLFAATQNGQVFVSSDQGRSWALYGA